MQTRREWLNSSLGIGGLLLAPTSILSAQEKIDFNPRGLEPIIRLSSNENPYGPSKLVQQRIKNSFILFPDYLNPQFNFFLTYNSWKNRRNSFFR